MQRIVAIGGGELKTFGTLSIDKEIIRLTRKRCPKTLFVPTASGDSEKYWKTFKKVYGDKLKCRTDVLYLIKDKPNKKQIKNKILNSDLIYVGGGNTLKMVKLWKKLGVDKILEMARDKGIVLSGLSAGSICWFKYGHTDSLRFHNPKKWRYIRMRGLGFINATHCPHYRAEKRKKDFQKMIKKHGGIGIALDNNCAIEILGGKFRIITSKKRANAYRIYRKKGKLHSEVIEQKKELVPISDLLV